MVEFLRPGVTGDVIDLQTANFVVEPLERGFGHTLGNCIRRVLLSSLPGSAITSVRIEGVDHEFSAVKGVREDVTDIILNLKKVVLTTEPQSGPQTVRLKAKGPKVLTAADIDCPAGVEVVSKDAPVATLGKDGKIDIEMTVSRGRGYSAADAHKAEDGIIGVIPIDSIFTPVTRVSFDVGHTRVGQSTDFDKLTLKVTTDGSIGPAQAVSMAGQIINEHMVLLVEQAPEVGNESIFLAAEGDTAGAYSAPIEDLELSVRSYNCLKRQGIDSLQQLLDCSELDLVNIRNFGSKSIEEVKDKLVEMGLSLKQVK